MLWQEPAAEENDFLFNIVTRDDDDRGRLHPSTAATNGPIVRPQVIYEHGEPWWHNTDGKTPDSSI
jgi:hypothetical protein